MQYNSSISQAFMVMSFAAAGLLMTVQLSMSDRSSRPSPQASSSPNSVPAREVQSRLVTSDPSEPSPMGPNTALSDPGNINPVEATINAPLSLQTPQRLANTSPEQAQEAMWTSSLNQWTWIVQPILYPIRAINDRWADSSHAPMSQPDWAINTLKEEKQATPALPSNPNTVPNTVSQIVSQSRIDSTPPSPLNQQATSSSQPNQTEHTLATRLEDNGQDIQPSLAPPLAVAEPQPPSIASVQPSTHVNPTPGDLTHQAITTDDQTKNDQTEQSRIQQEHPTARLVVDLSDRQLAFYQPNERVQTYPIAVGKAGWETPLGEFTVTDKDPSPLWQHPLTKELVPAGANSPLGSRWIGFWSDGIHQIGFHGTNQAQSIGQAISHGCIRLYDADIQELYGQVALGTPVIVQP